MNHSMPLRSLLNRLVYLDTAYVSDLYEVVTGKSPKTVIAKNQGKKAGASIPLFSAEVSAQETRSYTVSSLQMLASVLDVLNEEPAIKPADLRPAMSSRYGWLQGELSAFAVKSTVLDSKSGEQKVLASDAYFQLRGGHGAEFALITTPEYFARDGHLSQDAADCAKGAEDSCTHICSATGSARSHGSVGSSAAVNSGART